MAHDQSLKRGRGRPLGSRNREPLQRRRNISISDELWDAAAIIGFAVTGRANASAGIAEAIRGCAKTLIIDALAEKTSA